MDMDGMISKPTRPVLRYHGGKWQIGGWIISHFPAHRIYVEPYGGAASVLLQKKPSFIEVYNDMDDEIVNLFRVLRDEASTTRLRQMLELTPWSRTEFYESYEPTDDPIELARRVIVRSYMAFGTTSRRANRTGFRASARGRNYTGIPDWRNYPDHLINVTRRFDNVIIENQEALKVIESQDSPSTLFYCDPTYPAITRANGGFPSRKRSLLSP